MLLNVKKLVKDIDQLVKWALQYFIEAALQQFSWQIDYAGK